MTNYCIGTFCVGDMYYKCLQPVMLQSLIYACLIYEQTLLNFRQRLFGETLNLLKSDALHRMLRGCERVNRVCVLSGYKRSTLILL